MDSFDGLRESDSAVAARYLHIRSYLHDRVLGRLETQVATRFVVQPVRRIQPTLVAMVRTGFERAGEGEMWPVFFLTAVDISVALCLQIGAERLTNLGTMVNGPQRLKHRHWEDWWGWESSLGDLRPALFELSAALQEETLVAWYNDKLDWLVNSGLLRRK